MMNKYLLFSILLLLLLTAVFFIGRNSVPPCPEVMTSHTVNIDTVFIHDTVEVNKIKLTKVDKSKNIRTIIVQNDAPQNPENCDSLNDLYHAQYSYEIPLKDSSFAGVVNQTISENKIIAFDIAGHYLQTSSVDTIIIHTPPFKGFTVGCFGDKSSGINVGYEWSDKHVSIGYDLLQRGVVANFNLKLK